MFSSTIYVKVYANRLVLRHLERGETLDVTAKTPFTTTRLLVGEFSKAQAQLNALLKTFGRRRFQLFMPKILIQPLEMIEGGLSQVEQRLFLELAYSAGARKAKVYLGHELSDEAVKAQLSR